MGQVHLEMEGGPGCCGKDSIRYRGAHGFLPLSGHALAVTHSLAMGTGLPFVCFCRCR